MGIFNRLILTHRFALAIAAILFVAWIFDQHIPFAGVRVIEYTSGVQNGVVTRPHPLDRVRTDEEKKIERLIEDPVYFEVKAPVSYNRATIRVRYQNRTAIPIRMGLLRNANPNDVLFSPLIEAGKDGEWSIATAQVDLSKTQRINGRYHFLFSMPGVRFERPENGYLVLSHVTLRLEREPLFRL